MAAAEEQLGVLVGLGAEEVELLLQEVLYQLAEPVLLVKEMLAVMDQMRVVAMDTDQVEVAAVQAQQAVQLTEVAAQEVVVLD
jgi:hypothetical protein